MVETKTELEGERIQPKGSQFFFPTQNLDKKAAGHSRAVRVTVRYKLLPFCPDSSQRASVAECLSRSVRRRRFISHLAISKVRFWLIWTIWRRGKVKPFAAPHTSEIFSVAEFHWEGFHRASLAFWFQSYKSFLPHLFFTLFSNFCYILSFMILAMN